MRAAVAAGVPRDAIFVMTKTWPPKMTDGLADKLAAGQAGVTLEGRLKIGGIEYVDMYVEHHPDDEANGDAQDTLWQSMLASQARGSTRDVGARDRGKPGSTAVQLKVSPCQHADLTKDLWDENGNITDDPRTNYRVRGDITIVGLPGLGVCRLDPVMQQLAAAKGVGVVPYLIRWSMSVGLPTLVMSEHIEHLRDDMRAFDFALTPDELAVIDLLMSYGDVAAMSLG